MSTRAIYVEKQFAEMEHFADALAAAREEGKGVLDSAVSKEIAAGQHGVKLPAQVQALFDAYKGDDKHKILDSVARGIATFEREHGRLPTGDVIAAAIQQGMSSTNVFDGKGHVLDDANFGTGGSAHHDQISAQPNRVQVAVLSAIAEAIPFGAYLPTDIGSNEARLAILRHCAGSNFGEYTEGGSLDGVDLGKAYISSERVVDLVLASGEATATGKITGNLVTPTDTPVLRGRTKILINGYVGATENQQSTGSGATSAIAGSVVIASTTYNISGTVTIATGAVSLAFTPALPVNTKVQAMGYVDYEASPNLTPSIATVVDVYRLLANPWRALTSVTQDARTQYNSEINTDLTAEGLLALRNQFAAERHFSALNRLSEVAVNNGYTYDFDWSNVKSDKTRSEVWQDFSATLGVASQACSERTHEYGIAFLYVDKHILAQFRGMPSNLFESSGITDRPSIFRAGRLFGQYDVYYNPRLNYNGGTSRILAVGRSLQIGRNPIVLGDAVPPTFMELAVGTDMNRRNGFYARNFTELNPHQPSASGVAMISVTNQGLS